MIRRFAFAVAATAAVSVHAPNATAQSVTSQIRSLRSESSDDGGGLSPYTMWYWVQALGDVGYAPHATHSMESRTIDPASIPDAPSFAWAPLIRPTASTSVNSADDPSLPPNTQFFNPATLTDEHATAPLSSQSWQTQTTAQFADGDAIPTPTVQRVVAPPSLPGSDAWVVSDVASDKSDSTDDVGFVESAIVPSVDAPSLDVVASPEPGTLALFATGFVGIAAIAIKRKKRVA
jgi:hypothetical protein